MFKATHLDAEPEPWENSGRGAKCSVAGTRREVSLGEMKLEREVGGKFQIAL